MRLGFVLYDRSILDRMAGEAQIDSAALRRLEEGRHGAIHEAVYMTLDREYPGHHSYLKHLVAIATSLAAHGRVILLGRGMHYILPAEWGVKVRLVGSLEGRVERVRRELQLDEAAARRWIEEAQRRRDDLIRNLFHRDPSDPHDYDMVLNTDHLDEETCADMVVDLLERRCGSWEDRPTLMGQSRAG
jgi:cytidylate kinase